ncbi:PEP-CTERM sorting domain-containing protein [Alkalimarinus coralli]|uniref:PEP-CTERM sorting domain-containing protein n=1 Tax=Alkalimarinus coralli TaxID=2935863 RepID=UPI00202B59FF|nr:PEP-CTERM sorting domain-containing protein [Alkalimarinus coralli]
MKTINLICAAFMLLCSVSAHASLITQGDFSINMQEKIFTAPNDTAVDGSVELDSTSLTPTGVNAGFTGAISVDVSDVDQTIELFVTETFSSGVADFKYINALFDDLVIAANITAVSFVSDTLLSNPQSVVRSLSFTGNSISLDYVLDCCALIQSGGKVTLAYQTADIPEPGSLALLVLGLAGFCAMRRKQ